MVLNGGDHHLARQLEEARLEAAGDGHRPFDQRRHLIEQARSRSGRDRRRPRPRPRRRRRAPRRGASPKSATTLAPREPAARRTARRLERDGLRRVKAMTARGASGVESQHLDRHDLLAVAAARRRAPAARTPRCALPSACAARSASAAIAWLMMSPSRLAVAAPRSVPRNTSQAPLSVTSRSSAATSTPQLRANASGRLRGRARRIESAADRRPAPFDLTIRRRLGARRHEHGEAPRRRETRAPCRARCRRASKPLTMPSVSALDRLWSVRGGSSSVQQLEQQVARAHQADSRRAAA